MVILLSKLTRILIGVLLLSLMAIMAHAAPITDASTNTTVWVDIRALEDSHIYAYDSLYDADNDINAYVPDLGGYEKVTLIKTVKSIDVYGKDIVNVCIKRASGSELYLKLYTEFDNLNEVLLSTDPKRNSAPATKKPGYPYTFLYNRSAWINMNECDSVEMYRSLYDANNNLNSMSVTLKHLEKVTLVKVVQSIDILNSVNCNMYIRRANGQELYLKDLYIDYLTTYPAFLRKYLYLENPKKSNWSSAIWLTITQQKIKLGMTPEQTRLSWGEPDDINRTVGSFGTYEQWVYAGNYVYFENGKLTGWQN